MLGPSNCYVRYLDIDRYSTQCLSVHILSRKKILHTRLQWRTEPKCRPERCSEKPTSFRRNFPSPFLVISPKFSISIFEISYDFFASPFGSAAPSVRHYKAILLGGRPERMSANIPVFRPSDPCLHVVYRTHPLADVHI